MQVLSFVIRDSSVGKDAYVRMVSEDLRKKGCPTLLQSRNENHTVACSMTKAHSPEGKEFLLQRAECFPTRSSSRCEIECQQPVVLRYATKSVADVGGEISVVVEPPERWPDNDKELGQLLRAQSLQLTNCSLIVRGPAVVRTLVYSRNGIAVRPAIAGVPARPSPQDPSSMNTNLPPSGMREAISSDVAQTRRR